MVFSNNKVNVFNPGNNTLTASGTMNYPRWYPSFVSLRNGDKLILGGLIAAGVVAATPEVFHPGSGWRTLPGITSKGLVLSKRFRRSRWRGDANSE